MCSSGDGCGRDSGSKTQKQILKKPFFYNVPVELLGSKFFFQEAIRGKEYQNRYQGVHISLGAKFEFCTSTLVATSGRLCRVFLDQFE